MAIRNLVLNLGSGADIAAVSGHILINRHTAGSTDAGLWIFDSPERMDLTNPPQIVPLEVGVAYKFAPVIPSGTAIYAYMTAGAGDLNYADLVSLDPATLTPAANPEAAWWATADANVVDGAVVGDDLILTHYDTTTTNAGRVTGALSDPDIAALVPGPSATATALDSEYVPQSAGSLGADLVSNGSFTTDLAGWSGANWSWDAGTAKHATGNLAPLIQVGTVASVGTTYALTFTVSSRTDGWVQLYFGGAYSQLTASVGTFTTYVTATATDALQVVPSIDFVGAIDNISLKVMSSPDLRIDSKTLFTKPIKIFSNIDVADGAPISIGRQALPANTTGLYNVPSSNIAIGYYAGESNTEGHVTVVGFQAGRKNDIGVLTAFGKWAGASNTSGHATFFGNAAGRSNTTGISDAFGDEAGALNTTGTMAVFGYYAGHTSVTGIITAFGHLAGSDCGPDANYTAVGHQAGQRLSSLGATVVGYQAGQVVTTGRATAVGHEALRGTTTGSATALGYRAGTANTTGFGTFIGYQAGLATTTGQVTAVGSSAALEVTTGFIVALGYQAGYGTLANAPKTDTGGIYIGDQTGRTVPSTTFLENYVVIGKGANVEKSNQVKLGNPQITETVLQGGVILGKMTTTAKNALTATDGMVVYDTTLGKFQGREAGTWTNLI